MRTLIIHGHTCQEQVRTDVAADVTLHKKTITNKDDEAQRCRGEEHQNKIVSTLMPQLPQTVSLDAFFLSTTVHLRR